MTRNRSDSRAYVSDPQTQLRNYARKLAKLQRPLTEHEQHELARLRRAAGKD